VGDSPTLVPVSTTVVVDPSEGGALSSPDGALVLAIPAGEYDWLTLTLTDVTSLTGPAANLQVGSRSYMLVVRDSSDASVVNFSPPLEVTVFGDDLLEADAVLAFNPETGSFDALPSTEVEAGLAISLASLAPVPTVAEDPGE